MNPLDDLLTSEKLTLDSDLLNIWEIEDSATDPLKIESSKMSVGTTRRFSYSQVLWCTSETGTFGSSQSSSGQIKCSSSRLSEDIKIYSICFSISDSK